MKTLFLHPPSFDGYDGGAGARYQMKREVRSFWYPTWLAQPAALVSSPSPRWPSLSVPAAGRTPCGSTVGAARLRSRCARTGVSFYTQVSLTFPRGATTVTTSDFAWIA